MATPTSSVPRAKAALMRLMDADTTLSGVKHDWGPPPEDRLQHEHIWLGQVRDMEREPRLANQTRHEAYTLEVVVSVGRGGYDSQAIEERAWAIVAALEVAVNTDPRLTAYEAGNTIGQPFQVTVGPIAQRSFPTPDAGWASEITVSLDCDAHLRNQ